MYLEFFQVCYVIYQQPHKKLQIQKKSKIVKKRADMNIEKIINHLILSTPSNIYSMYLRYIFSENDKIFVIEQV